MSRSTRRIIIGSCFSLFALSGLASAETIRLTNGEWPPYLSEHLPHYGYVSHIVMEAGTGIHPHASYSPNREWDLSYLQ